MHVNIDQARANHLAGGIHLGASLRRLAKRFRTHRSHLAFEQQHISRFI